jgi:hypothetical protein
LWVVEDVGGIGFWKAGLVLCVWRDPWHSWLAIELESVGFAAGLEGEEGKIRTVLDDRIQSFVEQIDVDFLEGLVFVAMAGVGCSE